MNRLPPHCPDAAHGIAAMLGGMLCALLSAMLGLAGLRPARRAAGLEGVMALVLEAEAAALLELEPVVEWECVPAPWRNGRLLPARHARALGVALPCRRERPPVLGRGPPWASFNDRAWRTGMA
ncbi:MAG: hypothetical protein NT133_17985 [Alphaproteobacteria bacterium]|nr:hypothetical protein [Alphaproteobacteria bacterium]